MLAFVFIVYTFGVTIMLLNIAIGLIGDTLERVQDQKDTLVLQIRAELLLQACHIRSVRPPHACRFLLPVCYSSNRR